MEILIPILILVGVAVLCAVLLTVSAVFFAPKEDERAVESARVRCGVSHVANRALSSLSGGELKRIEIATVLARGTKVSIVDEPEAGIDLWSFNSLIKVFENMYSRTNGTIMIISHQERILDIADKIVVLKAGEIDAIGTKDEILPNILAASASCSKLEGGRN